MIIYERTYPVNVYETDIKGELSPVSLFNFFQDIAGRNASQLGFGRENLMASRNIWVLSRMSVEIEKMPFHWSDIKIKTWPRGTDGIFAVRDFEITSDSGEVIVSAASSWVVVDFDTRRLQRPDKALSDLNIEFPEKRAMEKNAIKINALPSAGNTIIEYKVTISDLDINQHVNNAMYLKWALNSYGIEYITSHSPVAIDVNYLNEGHLEDTVFITSAPDPENKNIFYHSVTRKGTETELCRIRLKWKEANQ